MAGKFNGKAAIVTKVSLGIGETTALALAAKGAEESLKVAEFFRQSAGQWRSERRYYTLPDGETQEMVSLITIRFLEQGCAQLQQCPTHRGQLINAQFSPSKPVKEASRAQYSWLPLNRREVQTDNTHFC